MRREGGEALASEAQLEGRLRSAVEESSLRERSCRLQDELQRIAAQSMELQTFVDRARSEERHRRAVDMGKLDRESKAQRFYNWWLQLRVLRSLSRSAVQRLLRRAEERVALQTAQNRTARAFFGWKSAHVFASTSPCCALFLCSFVLM